MHDPMTQAFSIPSFRRYPGLGSNLRRTLVTVWHVDPETDGSDDSCGWSRPKIDLATDWIVRLRKDLEFEEEHGGLAGQREREGCVWWWLLWLNRASYWHRRKPLSRRQLHREVFALSFSGNREPSGTPGVSLDDDVARLAYVFARNYLGLIRPWYRHPRWHVHHWRITIYPLLRLKRWLFSRCADCGKRFLWGYAPWTPQWNNGGPRWFRGEGKVYHTECGRDLRMRNDKVPEVTAEPLE